MKGVVFNIFNDMIDESFSPDMWDELVDRTCPASDAVYTSGATYPASELLGYVCALSQITGASQKELVQAFGRYLLLQFHERHPEFFQGVTVREFLISVDQVIHVEVRKLHTDAALPKFEYESPADDRLVMHYSSPRQLCALAEGLMVGVAEVFGTEMHFHQTECVHEGGERCTFDIRFDAPDARIGEATVG